MLFPADGNSNMRYYLDKLLEKDYRTRLNYTTARLPNQTPFNDDNLTLTQLLNSGTP